MSNLQKRVLMSKLPGLPPRPPIGPGGSRQGGRGHRDYTPLHFSNYFTSSRDVIVDKGDLGKNTFVVYEIGSGEGPAIFMLHGGTIISNSKRNYNYCFNFLVIYLNFLVSTYSQSWVKRQLLHATIILGSRFLFNDTWKTTTFQHKSQLLGS
jgi:hypothetical protein